MLMVEPLTVEGCMLLVMSVDITFPATTWYVRISVNFCLFEGFNNDATVPTGSFAKASSVGAKTVKDLQKKGEFVKITKAGFYESMVHNVDQVVKWKWINKI